MTMPNRIFKKLMAAILLMLCLIIGPLSISGYANVTVDQRTLTKENITNAFVVQTSQSSDYRAPINTFYDNSPTVFYVTQNVLDTPTQINYSGQIYNAGSFEIVVGSDLNALTAVDLASVFRQNATIFFAAGTYNDSGNSDMRFAYSNLSVVGLAKNGVEPATVIQTARSGGLYTNRLEQPNIYLENILFDGGNQDMLPGMQGERYFTINGATDAMDTGANGLVMRDCYIQNVGSMPSAMTKSIILSIERSAGQVNIENLTIRNTITNSAYAPITINSSKDVFVSNLTMASANARVIDLGKNSGTAMSPVGYDRVNAVFTGTLPLSSTTFVTVQDYRSNFISLPAAFKYLVMNTSNGSDTTSAIQAYTSLQPVAMNQAQYDLSENAFIIQQDSAIPVDTQFNAIQQVITAMKGDGSTGYRTAPQNIYIKLVARSNGEINSFAMPTLDAFNGNTGRVFYLVAVQNQGDAIYNNAMIPLSANATISLPATNIAQFKLVNIDFDNKAKYTFEEATKGITGTATVSDPDNSSGRYAGYPTYATYTSLKGATVAGTTQANFINSKFTSLAKEIAAYFGTTAINPSQGVSIAVNGTATLQSKLASIATNSFSGTSLTMNMQDTADDSSGIWYSSDPSVATIGQNTGTIQALKAGTTKIKLKASDSNNQGEIEKPFVEFTLTVGSGTGQFRVIYNGNNANAKNIPLDNKQYTNGATAVISSTPPTALGFEFLGWSTKAATGGTLYKPGFAFIIRSDTNLYAQWRQLATASPSPSPTATNTLKPTNTATLTPTNTATQTLQPANSPTSNSGNAVVSPTESTLESFLEEVDEGTEELPVTDFYGFAIIGVVVTLAILAAVITYKKQKINRYIP